MVVALDGAAVANSEAFIRAVGDKRPGDAVKLELFRDGKRKKVSVTLGERPEEQDLANGKWTKPESEGPVNAESVANLGIRVRPASELRGYAGKSGVVITSVASGSPAEAGLRAGDRIIECNGRTVGSSRDLAKALSAEGAPVFVVDRRGTQMLVELPR